MSESDAQGLTDEALEALMALFAHALGALADCERIAAMSLPEERDLPLRFTDLYRNLSGQIAAILAAHGKAVDVVGTWISARNRLVAELHVRRPDRRPHPDALLLAAAVPVRDAFAAVFDGNLPRAAAHDLLAMRAALDGLLARRRGPA